MGDFEADPNILPSLVTWFKSHALNVYIEAGEEVVTEHRDGIGHMLVNSDTYEARLVHGRHTLLAARNIGAFFFPIQLELINPTTRNPLKFRRSVNHLSLWRAVVYYNRYVLQLRAVGPTGTFLSSSDCVDLIDSDDCTGEFLQPLKHGYWCSRQDIILILELFSRCDEGSFYGVFAADEIVNQVAESLDGFNIAAVNTTGTGHGGQHWVWVAWFKHSRAYDIAIFDPKSNAYMCQTIRNNFQVAHDDGSLGDGKVTIRKPLGVGFQPRGDGWTCGFHVIFGIIFLGVNEPTPQVMTDVGF